MTSVKLLLPDFTPEVRRAYWSRRDFRKYKSRLADEMTYRLSINSQRRQYRKERERHISAGLPWPPPPPKPEPPGEKKSRKKRDEASKKQQSESTRRIERERTIRRMKIPRARSTEPVYAKKNRTEEDRVRSAENELTEFSKEPLTRNLQRTLGYSRSLVEAWGSEASAKVKAAQARATTAAEAAIIARTDLERARNTEGEATLREAKEAAAKAAFRAETELARRRTNAAKFELADITRAKLESIGMAKMEEEHARRMRETDKKFVNRAVEQISLRASGYGRDARRALEQIYLRASGYDREARSAELTALEKKWSKIEVIANSLKTSVEHTNETDTKRIIAHLGAARTMIENTSADNDNEADKIIAELYKAQAIGIREIASSRPRTTNGGLRRTKKHIKKHKKKRGKTSKAKH